MSISFSALLFFLFSDTAFCFFNLYALSHEF